MKRYLGDGVYVDYERGGLVLTTEDGLRVTNTIFLEAEVLENLERYVSELVTPAAPPATGPTCCGYHSAGGRASVQCGGDGSGM